MKNTNINNNKSFDDIKYISLLCEEKKDLILKTEYGIGRYQFQKFNELQGTLVLEFQLLEDSRYKDTSKINNNIGNKCFLTVQQYLTVYSYLAQA